MTVVAIEVQWTHYHVHEKYDLYDLSYNIMCATRRWAHWSLWDKYGQYQVSSVTTKGPKENIPHNIILTH